MSANNIVMWEIMLNKTDWDFFGLWFRGRLWRFKIHFRRNIMCFRKSYVCTKKLMCARSKLLFLTVQQNLRSSLHGTEIRWFAHSGIVGSDCFCPWKYFSNFRSIHKTWVVKTNLIIKSMLCKTFIDFILSNVQSAHQEALLYVFEDSEAVIKMIVKKCRSPTMRHVSRTHRVVLDWLLNQFADISTKGNFTRDEWNCLFCWI